MISEMFWGHPSEWDMLVTSDVLESNMSWRRCDEWDVLWIS